MKNIEDIKTELVLKMQQRSLDRYEIRNLPKNDELRTFMCRYGSEYAYMYAYYVDKIPHPETRTAACKSPGWAYQYAYWIDKTPTKETKAAACKDPSYASLYALYVEKKTTYALYVDNAPAKEIHKAIDLSHYPHKCPRCYSPAYIGMMNNIDCSNKDCK